MLRPKNVGNFTAPIFTDQFSCASDCTEMYKYTYIEYTGDEVPLTPYLKRTLYRADFHKTEWFLSTQITVYVFSSRQYVSSVWNWNPVTLRSWLLLLSTELHSFRSHRATNINCLIEWPCLLLPLQFFQLARCWSWRTIWCSCDAQLAQEQDSFIITKLDMRLGFT